MSEKRQLPKLADLHHDAIVGFKDDQFNLLLSQQPAKEWVKEHPFAKGIKYLPIERVEYMLTKIFGEWRVEVQREGQMFNSVYVCVRLHLKSPITGEWFYHDGLGAVGVQTDKGESASNLAAIKQDAIMKALPAAESYAIKDAAEKLGRLFGKDLNRKDIIEFTPTFEKITNEQLKSLVAEKWHLLTEKEQEQANRIVINKEEANYSKLKTLLNGK